MEVACHFDALLESLCAVLLRKLVALPLRASQRGVQADSALQPMRQTQLNGGVQDQSENGKSRVDAE